MLLSTCDPKARIPEHSRSQCMRAGVLPIAIHVLLSTPDRDTRAPDLKISAPEAPMSNKASRDHLRVSGDSGEFIVFAEWLGGVGGLCDCKPGIGNVTVAGAKRIQ